MPYPYTNPLAGSTAPLSISRPQLSYSDFKGHSKDYFMGIHCGYISGGFTSPDTTRLSSVDRYNFSNYSSTAVSVATLTRAAKNVAGASAFRYIGFNNYGLTAGGDTPPISLSQNEYSNIIDKFNFKSEGSAADVGDLTIGRKWLAGHSSPYRGYFSGGSGAPTSYQSRIDRVPYNTTENAVTVGSLTVARFNTTGCSSESRGYTVGGVAPGVSTPGYTVIDSFPFHTDANAIDVGDLYVYEYNATGVSSYERGYSVGSWLSPTYGPSHPALAKIQSFPFASQAPVTSYRNGDLSFYRSDGAGFGSITHGYLAGGSSGPESSPPVSTYNVIDRWPFAVDNVTASDIGDLSGTRASSAGLQN